MSSKEFTEKVADPCGESIARSTPWASAPGSSGRHEDSVASGGFPRSRDIGGHSRYAASERFEQCVGGSPPSERA